MIDMREYKEAIKLALERVREEEKHIEPYVWGWKIKSINKNEAKIMWGYFEYLTGETEGIKVTVTEEEDNEYLIKAVDPAGHKEMCLIGEKDWCDFSTITVGLICTIGHAARHAMRTW